MKFGSVNQKIVGQRIRRVRQSLELSQENVAEDLGMTKGAFSKIERGLTNLPLTRLIEIARVLKVEVAVFFETSKLSGKVEDSSNKYGFATKGDIEELVHMIKQLAHEVEQLKNATPPQTKTSRKKK